MARNKITIDDPANPDVPYGDATPPLPGNPEAPYEAPATTPPPPEATPTDDYRTGPWDAGRVSRFFQSKGVTPNATSPNYWAQKWQEWGQNDPDYFLRRLNAADEIVGGPQNSPFQERASSTGSTASATTAPVSPFTSQIRELLMGRLKGMLGPVDANAPQIAEPFQAAQLQNDRALEMERRILAEKLYAQGGGHVDAGMLNQAVQQSAERSAANLGGLRASLIQNEYDGRRQELESLFQQALSTGDAETARAIQTELANLQAALTREGYGVNLAQYAQNQNNNLFGRI